MKEKAVDQDRPNAVTGEAVVGADAVPEGRATATATGEPDSPVEARRSLSYGFVPPAVWALARGIAAVLGEIMPPPIRLITRVVERLGPERARAFLGQALTVEAQGGLTLPDGHRRTPGGTFFYLVRTSDAISREDKDDIFPRQGGRPLRAGASGTPATPTPAVTPAAAWTDDTYREIAPQLQQDIGRATTVKITVIGRPGAAVEQGQAIALALVSEKVPDLPKGLPEPPVGTRYTVLVARKQWTKVAEALAADPEDAAIIEGYAALDPRVEGIAVYATSVTTKRMQAAKRATTTAATP